MLSICFSMFFYILLSWQVLSGIFCSLILMFFAEDLVALPETMAFGCCWLWCRLSFVRSATRTLGARRANGRDRTTLASSFANGWMFGLLQSFRFLKI